MYRTPGGGVRSRHAPVGIEKRAQLGLPPPPGFVPDALARGASEEVGEVGPAASEEEGGDRAVADLPARAGETLADDRFERGALGEGSERTPSGEGDVAATKSDPPQDRRDPDAMLAPKRLSREPPDGLALR